MRLLKIKWAMIFNKSRSCWSADSNNNHNQIVHVLQVKLNLVAINNSRAMSETAQTSAVSENRCHCHYSLYFVIHRHYLKYIFWQTPPPSLPSVEIPSSRRRRLSQASRTRLHLDRDDGDDITRSDVWRHHCVVAQAFNCASCRSWSRRDYLHLHPGHMLALVRALLQVGHHVTLRLISVRDHTASDSLPREFGAWGSNDFARLLLNHVLTV